MSPMPKCRALHIVRSCLNVDFLQCTKPVVGHKGISLESPPHPVGACGHSTRPGQFSNHTLYLDLPGLHDVDLNFNTPMIFNSHYFQMIQSQITEDTIKPCILFLVSHFNFLFVPCGGLSWYPSAFYCTLNTHYRIVSYRKRVNKLEKLQAQSSNSGLYQTIHINTKISSDIRLTMTDVLPQQ